MMRARRNIIFGIAALLTALSSLCMNFLLISPNIYISLLILNISAAFRGLGSGVIFGQTNFVVADLCDSEDLVHVIGLISFSKGIGFMVGSVSNGGYFWVIGPSY